MSDNDEYARRLREWPIASAMLRDAILAARAGTCPATPLEPAGLPRDLATNKVNGAKGGEVLPPPETREDAVLRLFSQGRTKKVIARELGLSSWAEAEGVLRAIRYRKPSIYWRALERHNQARGLVE